MLEEIWKVLADFKHYEISNYGRIRTVQGKYIKLRLSNTGYTYVTLRKSGENRGRRKFIHRLVFETFVRLLTIGELVHHIDEDSRNNVITNLRVMTRAEHNSLHKFQKPCMGNSAEKGPGSKLSPKEVHQIHMLLKLKFAVRDIANMYAVDLCTIYNIRKGRSWQDIYLLFLRR